MDGQWVVFLKDVPNSGRSWQLDIARRWLEDKSLGNIDALTGLCSDLHADINLARKGDIYQLNGSWQVSVRQSCSRCTEDFVRLQQGEIEREFVLDDSPPERRTESCEVVEFPGRLDLLDLLREEVWLSWKLDVVCSEQCKGLCSRCGQNLNQRSCNCAAQEEDHPFAVLRKLRLDA